MADQELKLDLNLSYDIKEVYPGLCPTCRDFVKGIMKAKVKEQVVNAMETKREQVVNAMAENTVNQFLAKIEEEFKPTQKD